MESPIDVIFYPLNKRILVPCPQKRKVMFSNRLPDPHFFEPNSGRPMGNAVICAITRTEYYYPDHVTPYLLVANFSNTGHYKLNGRPTFINDHFFYFLNAGDRLEIDFRRREPVETMLVAFSDKLICEVAGFYSKTTDALLENPAEPAAGEWRLPNIPLAYNDIVTRCLTDLRQNGYREDPETAFVELLHALWDLNEGGKSSLTRIITKRTSTREELYRRLFLAESYMQDNFSDPLTIDELAKAACMNKFHFLKSFKQRYGLTPHQYLIRLKLKHARILLQTGKYSVAGVCRLIGFESPATFTHLFKKTHGFLPSKFPKLNK
jgi:AraC-like DNA-binding protein